MRGQSLGDIDTHRCEAPLNAQRVAIERRPASHSYRQVMQYLRCSVAARVEQRTHEGDATSVGVSKTEPDFGFQIRHVRVIVRVSSRVPAA
jgi:hypothetical protein